MTTEIQAYNPGGALADLTEDYGSFAALGLIGYDVQDLSLPRIVIVNGANQMNEWDARGGQFHNVLTNENFDALEGFVLVLSKGQIWSLDYSEAQKKRDNGEEVPIFCKSSDGVKPDPDFVKGAPSTSCKTCPKGRAQRNPEGGYFAPECSNSRRLLFATWDEEQGDYQIAMFSVSKTATRSVDDFVKGAIAKNRPMWGLKVRITTEKTSGNGNTWFLPVIDVLDEKVPQEHLPLIKEKIDAFLPMLKKAEVHEADLDAHPATAPATQPATADDYTGGPTLDATATAATPEPPPPPAPEVDVNDKALQDDLGF